MDSDASAEKKLGRLVLTRKEGEQVVIGSGQNAIVITVMDTIRTSIKLSFESPVNVPINRAEVARRKNLI